MFQLTLDEKDEVVTNCDHLENLKFSSVCPYAFTEHGAVMVATVLNTPRAVEVSLAVVRAFIKLREMVATHKELAEKLNAMEQKYDDHFRVVFDAIRQLMSSDVVEKESIGFKVKEEVGIYQ
jgi:phage regulator Rha-like protein